MSYGIYIVNRRTIGLEESIRQLAQYLYDFTTLTRRQRIIQRNRTERLSDLLDWKILASVSLRDTMRGPSVLPIRTYNILFLQYYRQARQHALHVVYPETEQEGPSEGVEMIRYPRPMSEPPSPSASRGTTPAPSEKASSSDVETDVDSEEEVNGLLI